MALIQCPECHKAISGLCEKCPHCRFPIDIYLPQQEQKPEKGRSFWRCFWRRIWIAAVAVVPMALSLAVILFCYAYLFIPPTYTATAEMYISSNGMTHIFPKVIYSDIPDLPSTTDSNITASQMLIQSSWVIAKSTDTLAEVRDYADVNYSYDDLKDMISFGYVNNTEIFYIRVDSPDPYDAEAIAEAYCHILPKQVPTVFEGTTVTVVQSPRIPTSQSAPVLSDYALTGAIIGAVVGLTTGLGIAAITAAVSTKKQRTI